MSDLVGIALRISVMYVVALTLLRVSGKRTIDHLSPMDFVITMAIGDMFDDIIWAEVPLAQGLVGFTAFILCHVVINAGGWGSHAFRRLIAGRSRRLLHNGQVDHQALAAERMHLNTFEQQLRQVGEDDPQGLELACLEVSGALSVLKAKPLRPLQRRDVPALARDEV
jgi:uncharacterized membrane protein YcaP (DUF421 family)